MAPAYQFKTPWFKVVGEFEYVHKTEIKDWRIVADNAATPSETPQISTGTAETVNVSVEGENAEKTPVFSSREDVITYLYKTHGIEYDAGEVVYLKDGCCAEEHADGGEWCIYRNEDSDECVETVRIAPQSPETPQMVECITDTPKLRETAEIRQNRAIGSAQHHQHSALGANGYAMLNDASATMAAMNVRHDTLRNTLRSVTYVPRECSTANAPPVGRPDRTLSIGSIK